MMQRRKFLMIAGGAVAWPLASYAQRRAMPVVGYLHFAEPTYVPTANEFLQGLKEAGFVEGQNVAVEYRWAEGRYDRLPAMASDLVGLKVDLIAAFGPPPGKSGEKCNLDDPYHF
jgi:putative tryptophan/tyrosine transport system substrate-binding protein